MAPHQLVQLPAQRAVGHQPWRFPPQRGDGGGGVQIVVGKRGQEHGAADRRRVERDGAVVADDAVGRDERLPPRPERRDQHQPSAARLREPRPDLPRAVPVPDVGMQNGGRAVLVGRQFRGQPRQQREQRVGPVPVAEQGTRAPRRIEHDQPLPAGHPEGPPEAFAQRQFGQDAVVARVPGEHGGGGRLGAGRGQPLHLLGMRENGRGRYRPPPVQLPLGSEAEGRRLGVAGRRPPPLVVPDPVRQRHQVSRQRVQAAAVAGRDGELHRQPHRLLPGQHGQPHRLQRLGDAREEGRGAGAGGEQLEARITVEQRQHVQQAGRRGDVVHDEQGPAGRPPRHPPLGVGADGHPQPLGGQRPPRLPSPVGRSIAPARRDVTQAAAGSPEAGHHRREPAIRRRARRVSPPSLPQPYMTDC